ncbi:hypothetical protein N752_29245 [Desulforamulus aquiferis]|nr:hypothetical protein [Desulforamulus aquiferis]RYD01665.1 hypothetical protein N752_29245 [Desulforamulus aquiferis]
MDLIDQNAAKKSELNAHLSGHLRVIVSQTPPESNASTYWFEDLGESIELAGGGLIIGNASMDNDKEIWFDRNI